MPRPGRPEPVFRKVWSDLRAQILSDAFAPDVALPTEAQIAVEYDVSRQTVRRAFLDLVAEGLVTRVPGRGTFVTQASGRYLRQFGSVEDLMALSSDSQMRIVTPLAAVIDPIASSRLRLSNDHVHRVAFVRLHCGEVFSHTTVSLPPEAGQLLPASSELRSEGATSQATVIGLLDTLLSQPIRDAEQSITIGRAEAEVADALGLESATPVLRVDRLYFDSTGKAVELAVSHFHPNRYSYHVRLRRRLP